MSFHMMYPYKLNPVLLIRIQLVEHFPGFFSIIEVNCGIAQYLVCLVALAGYQHGILPPGCIYPQLNGPPSVGFAQTAVRSSCSAAVGSSALSA